MHIGSPPPTWLSLTFTLYWALQNLWVNMKRNAEKMGIACGNGENGAKTDLVAERTHDSPTDSAEEPISLHSSYVSIHLGNFTSLGSDGRAGMAGAVVLNA